MNKKMRPRTLWEKDRTAARVGRAPREHARAHRRNAHEMMTPERVRIVTDALARAAHVHELPQPAGPVHVHIDTAHAGVGGVSLTQDGFPLVWGAYPQHGIAPVGPWTYELQITPIVDE